ncbi:MAG TPA: glycosyltransferase family 1 protein [Pyrinomonadaceae bacterium]|nr:glycosyltransferase family 1 protein [Pyrinomonadaceae bacterium]
MDGRLRVAINAQIMPGTGTGGIETVLRALTALARLEGGAEEYVFVGPHDDPDWLRDLLPPGQQVVRGPAPAPPGEWKVDRLEPFKRALGPLRPAARGVRRFISYAATGNTPATTAAPAGLAARHEPKNFYERLGCDVIHFPFQYFETSARPSVYNPHDLQHLHHPEFFAPEEVTRRETLHRAACRAARTVVVASEFVKRDVVGSYGVSHAKVQVIPWAPPPLTEAARRSAEESVPAVREKFRLGDSPFALYPAMTWEHKNHLRLLESLAILRDRERLEVRVVCTGFKTDFWPRVERRVSELGLESQVKFPGLVSQEDLGALYRAAQFVFIPTLFEAASAPMFEAWQHGTPVACSSVTSLPEQAGGAALLFDPASAEEIADALARMTTFQALREELSQRGTRRLEDFRLERTAKAYRAVYRRAAGLALDAEDLALLDWDWTRETRGEVEARGA